MNKRFFIFGLLITSSFLSFSNAQDDSKANNDKINLRSYSQKIEEDSYTWLKDPSWTNEHPQIKNKKIKKVIKKHDNAAEKYFARYDEEKEKLIEAFDQLAPLAASKQNKSQNIGNKHFFDEFDEKTGLRKIYAYDKELKSKKLILDLSSIFKRKLKLSTIFKPKDDEDDFDDDYIISPDGKYIACSVDRNGTGFSETRIFDIENKKLLKEKFIVSDLSTDIVWPQNSSEGFYYLESANNSSLANILKWHSYNQKPSKDSILFTDETKSYTLGLASSPDSKEIIFFLYGYFNNEFYILKNKKLIKILDRNENLKCTDVDLYKGDIYFTELDTQSRGALRKISITNSEIVRATIIPPTQDLIFSCIQVFDQGIVTVLAKPEGDELALWNPTQKQFISLTPNLKNKKIEIDDDQDPSSSEIKITYTSCIEPETQARVSFDGKLEILSSFPDIPGYAPNNYVVSYVYAPTQDGKKIPISLVSHKNKQKNKDCPLVLQAYGAYGDSDNDYIDFDSFNIALLNSGVTLGFAHVRGGGIYGPKWHNAGKGLNKKNTFEDYITCAECLIKEGKVKKGNLVAQGGSAGGLIMGYIANHRPDLFKAIVARVPFLHIYQDCKDTSLLLNPLEISEWGDIKQKEVTEYIKSYCPYEGIKKQDYPAMLIQYGLYDNNVPYWNALKFGEKVKNHNTSANPIILQGMESGHEVDDDADIDLLIFLKSLFGDKVNFSLNEDEE